MSPRGGEQVLLNTQTLQNFLTSLVEWIAVEYCPCLDNTYTSQKTCTKYKMRSANNKKNREIGHINFSVVRLSLKCLATSMSQLANLAQSLFQLLSFAQVYHQDDKPILPLSRCCVTTAPRLTTTWQLSDRIVTRMICSRSHACSFFTSLFCSSHKHYSNTHLSMTRTRTNHLIYQRIHQRGLGYEYALGLLLFLVLGYIYWGMERSFYSPKPQIDVVNKLGKFLSLGAQVRCTTGPPTITPSLGS